MGTVGCFFFFPLSCPHQLALLPAQAGETAEQILAPAPAPAELESVSPAADSTSAKLPLDLGTCQVPPTTTVAQPEHPSLTGRTTSVGSHSSGKAGRQLAVGRFLPAGAAAVLIQLGPPCLALQAAWCCR